MTIFQEKGDVLEAAVLAIERQILQKSPSVKEKSYVIESKKVIVVGGVRHEIDVFVTFDLGLGYKPVYIFECKNWKEAVGKNEIIVFAEKIGATGAQRGFFVAKSFTSDAEAQSRKEPRMELVIAAEHDPANTIVPFKFHFVSTKPLEIRVEFRRSGMEAGTEVIIDLSIAKAAVNGTSINLAEYLNAWANEAIQANMRSFRSERFAAGAYDRDFTVERAFEEGFFTLDDIPIRLGVLTVKYQVALVWPAAKSDFEVNGRGRVISLEGCAVGDADIGRVQFVFGPEQEQSGASGGGLP